MVVAVLQDHDTELPPNDDESQPADPGQEEEPPPPPPEGEPSPAESSGEGNDVPISSDEDSDIGEETYSLSVNPRGWVYIINDLIGCIDEVERIKIIFETNGYKVEMLENISGYESLVSGVQMHDIRAQKPVVVFFFGYGHNNSLFIGPSKSDLLSYRKFYEVFHTTEENVECPRIYFTNTCFAPITENVQTHEAVGMLIRDVFHYCVKVNGHCTNGSLFAKSLIQNLEGLGFTEEFNSLQRHVTSKLNDFQRDESHESYMTSVRYIGIHKDFYFSPQIQ